MNNHAQTMQPSGHSVRLPLWLKQHHPKGTGPLQHFTVQAPDKKTLFCRVAWTLFFCISNLSNIQPREKTVMAVQGATLPLLMSAWLTELAALHDERHLIFKRFTIMEMSTTYLKAEAEGEDNSEGEAHVSRSTQLAQTPVIEYAGDQWTAELAFSDI